MTPTELDLCQQCFERWPALRPKHKRYELHLLDKETRTPGWWWYALDPRRGEVRHSPVDSACAAALCRVALEDECLRRGWWVKARGRWFDVLRWNEESDMPDAIVPELSDTPLIACARALLGDEK